MGIMLHLPRVLEEQNLVNQSINPSIHPLICPLIHLSSVSSISSIIHPFVNNLSIIYLCVLLSVCLSSIQPSNHPSIQSVMVLDFEQGSSTWQASVLLTGLSPNHMDYSF